MNLFHNQTLIGKIEGVSPNGFDFHASIALTADFEQYKKLFEFWVDEEKNPADEVQFADQLFENWFVEDFDGERQEVYLPGIWKENGAWEIMWRYV